MNATNWYVERTSNTTNTISPYYFQGTANTSTYDNWSSSTTTASASSSLQIPYYYKFEYIKYESEDTREQETERIQHYKWLNKWRDAKLKREIKRGIDRREEEKKDANERARKLLQHYKWLNKWKDAKLKKEIERREKEKKDANEKARKLLLEYLDEENKARVLQNKPIEVASSIFEDIKYLIPQNFYSKIHAIKKDKVVSELCVTIDKSDLPLDDVILTKLLHIKNNEKDLLKTANHSHVQENLLARLN